MYDTKRIKINKFATVRTTNKRNITKQYPKSRSEIAKDRHRSQQYGRIEASNFFPYSFY